MTAGISRPVTVAIIGAGMSGINMAIQLRRAGIESFTVFEKAGSVGGTWRENRYPGLTCDVPSQWYTYSYEPNPDWTHRFARGPEIRHYFERVARKYGVIPKIRFNTEIVETLFGDTGWTLKTRNGEVHSADVLVAATGVLHHPSIPPIEGLDDFSGPCFHSAQWPDGLDLKGKRVGIIGSGATAAQILPAIVDQVREAHLFQRTPSWIIRVPDRRYTGIEKAVMRRIPALSHLSYHAYDRIFTYFAVNSLGTGDGSDRLQPMIRRRCTEYLETVKDPELRRKLTPAYEPMCKRLVVSTKFYEAIQHPNARLETGGIERLQKSGILLKDGKQIGLDVIVLATGFHAHNYIRPAKVTGRGGVQLEQVWSGGLRNYLSLTVPGFPNLFFLIGPNSPIGNYSLIPLAESQAGYIMQCIDRIRSGSTATIEPTEKAADDFGRRMKGAMPGTVWSSGCSSWYLDDQGIPTLWPYSPKKYLKELAAPKWDDFRFSPVISTDEAKSVSAGRKQAE